DEYYQYTRQVGSHTAMMHTWVDSGKFEVLDNVLESLFSEVPGQNLSYHFYLSPLAHRTGEAVETPEYVSGDSLGDPAVRRSYIKDLLRYAESKPEILGVGIEVNNLLYHKQDQEYQHFATLCHEAYKAIKAKYPKQTVTITFQWDLMQILKQHERLKPFKGCVDVYSFSSYPNIVGREKVAQIPDDYYRDIRKYLPTERVAISELGWYAGKNSTEQEQALFYEKVPGWVDGIGLEWLTITYLFDQPYSFVKDRRWSSMGLRAVEGDPRPSWDIVRSYSDKL
ncbi:MAG: glycosyl hydrolase 53 family protein, partial [Pseudomonadota bacterium]